MAFRRPVYYDSGNIKEMSDTDIVNLRKWMLYQYGLNQSVRLSVVSSGGNLGTLTDTRMTAGAYRTNPSRYPYESETPEPGQAVVYYSRLHLTRYGSSFSDPDGNGKFWPAYYDGSNIRAMSSTDVWDTFINPALDYMVANSYPELHRAYTISTSTPSGYSAVSGTAVYVDTRANTGLYTAGGIQEALDQPFTVSSWYLYNANLGSQPSTRLPLIVDSNNNLKEAQGASLLSTLGTPFITAARDRIHYSFTDNSGTLLGSVLTNTKLNGAGAYNIRYVNANDYRAQEFPNGSAVVQNTYSLRIKRT